MKWNICGILLILTVSFCISLGKQCSRKRKHYLCPAPSPVQTTNYEDINELDMFILGTDGFMGYLTVNEDECSNGIWGTKKYQSTTFCNSSTVPVKQELNVTVFSFEENTTCTENLCTTNSSDTGVVLSRHKPYRLNISRDVIPTIVCLIEGKCQNDTLKNRFSLGHGCNWTIKDFDHFQNQSCNVTCVNLTKSCENAQYDPSCSDNNAGEESKINNIKISDTAGTCYKCGSPYLVVEKIDLQDDITNKFNTTKPETDASAAAEVMRNFDKILIAMKNLSVAAVSMGNVEGIVKKITSESIPKMTYFIYSSESGIRILDDAAVVKNFPNAFSIPEEAAKKALNQSAGNAFIALFRFPNMTKDAENSTVLNNEVYAIEMGANINNLSNPISLTFTNPQKVDATAICKSWDGNGHQPNWTDEGCNTLIKGDKIICDCKHLTFFAVLMIPTETISDADLSALTYITYIGCGLSLFFLSIGLFMHFLIRKVKATDSVHVLINLFVALFLLNAAFLSNEYVARAENDTVCRVMAGLMHYCLLSSFTWFGVEAFHLCLQMAKHSVNIKHYVIKISVVGWAPPALIVSILYAFHVYGEQIISTGTQNVTMCWIQNSNVHLYVNIGYYSFIFIFTFITFIIVLRWLSMLKLSRMNKVAVVQRTATSDITTILGLCCMLGLTWSFAFFGYGAMRLPSYYIFTILNSLQGLFLFIYYLKATSLIGESAASDESDVTEATNVENPYEDLPTEDTKKPI